MPVRVDARDVDRARQALAGNGAVVLTGLLVTPDALTVAAGRAPRITGSVSLHP
jgi:hypothetical protein